MSFKSSRPVPDTEAYEFIKKNIDGNCLYKKDLPETFCKEYLKWICNSKLNNLLNLQNYKSLQYVHGTSQSFDFFYLTNHKKRFRTFKGDFMYHKIMWRNGYEWKYIEDGEIEKNDAVIFSLPFSDYGDIHPRTYDVLDKCDELKVPVFVDCAYLVMARDIEFDFDRECIEGISFSLSKGFYGAEHLRIGMRLTKKFIDDPVEVFNDFQMINWIGPDVGLKIINNFDFDFIQNKYHDKQIEICKELEITPSKCAIFGITDEEHEEFGHYDRGTEWRRVCISQLLGDMKDIHSKS
tara:strand:- start:871 stop:1752 length:882 start_codon:yes stop_codon:yes gene_type:complete